MADLRWQSNAVGSVYASAGLVGFVLTGLGDLGAPSGQLLIIFLVNPLQNGVHLLLGLALIACAATGPAAARRGVAAAAAVFALLGLGGLLVVQSEAGNVLAVNQAGNALHLATAGVLVCALSAARRRRARQTRERSTVGRR